MFISKLTYLAVSIQINDHLLDNGLYPSAQSSYRKNHSTETALLKVKNDILLDIPTNSRLLFVHLPSWDWGGGGLLEWFASYLFGRRQRISVRGCQSEKSNLSCGIPQGSCLGPLLFTIYSSSLIDAVQNHSPSVHFYADDTQLYVSFSPEDEMGQLMPLQQLSVAFRCSGTGCEITDYY